MTLIFRNTLYRILTISRMLNAFGSYIYNLVFIIYAASLPYATVSMFVANIVTIIPTLFTFWVGVRADKTGQKTRMIVGAGVVQALLFTLVAIIISNKTFMVFGLVCFINVISDVISDYSAGLRMPIMQFNLDKEDLYEAYSFNQFLSYICNIAGQGFGVWLLTVSDNNFSLVAILNAVSFLLSSLILLIHRERLTYKELTEEYSSETLFDNLKNIHTNMDRIFKNTAQSSFASIFLAVLSINALGGAISSIYDFYFLKNNLFNLTFGQSVMAVQIVLILGAILGSLTPKDYFGRKPLTFLLFLNSLTFLLVALSNILRFNPLVGIGILTFAAYLMGKAIPKLDAMLMENLPTEILAQSNNFLAMLFTLSVPIGTFIFSTLAIYNMMVCWLVFGVLSSVALLLASKTRTT